jgi:hypothetical protein
MGKNRPGGPFSKFSAFSKSWQLFHPAVAKLRFNTVEIHSIQKTFITHEIHETFGNQTPCQPIPERFSDPQRS